MKLVVGLGNPGSQYEKTRHNVGFRVIDLAGTELGAVYKTSSDFNADFCKTKFKDDDLVLLKPLTYMNLSGRAVSAVIRWYKIEISDVLIVHDDVSLPLGKIRVQQGGGAGGQHGIESIIECLGVNNFDRIKVGVGPDPGGELRAHYVLSQVKPEDEKLLADSLDLAKKALRSWLTNGAQVTANRYNGKNLAEPEVKKEKPKPRPVGLPGAPEPGSIQSIDSTANAASSAESATNGSAKSSDLNSATSSETGSNATTSS